MKYIDFLPEIYAQKRVQRRARAWWCLAAAAFAVIVLLAASTQWMVRHGIERELAQIEPSYADALARQTQLQQIRQELAREEEIADLYAYLAHPWPRSQLLAAVIRPLPDSVRLTDIAITHETLPAGPVIVQAKGAETPSPAAADLRLLRAEFDGRQTILTIGGTATSMSELHAYVDQLGKSRLIAAAHLKGVEAAAAGNFAVESRFHLHVAVRPGYGQEGGPAITPPHLHRAKTSGQDSVLSFVHVPLKGADHE